MRDGALSATVLVLFCASCATTSRGGASPSRLRASAPGPSAWSTDYFAGDAERPASMVPVLGWASDWEVGLAGEIALADGEPANDMPGFGIFVRTSLDERWRLRFTLDQQSFDFERPAKVVGITQDEDLDTIDASAESTILGAWIERSFQDPDGRNEPFLGAGLGVASVDVDDVSGPVEGGGTFDITTDAGTEFLVSLAAGYRRHLSDTWTIEGVVRIDQHFADWEVEDRNSGAKGNIDDYLTCTFLLGLGFGF